MKRFILQGITAGLLLLSVNSCTKKDAVISPAQTATSSNYSTASSSIHYIGESFGGGIIFYLDSTGKHGLIAAATDYSVTNWDNGVHKVTGASGTGIGTGACNTKKIIDTHGRTGNYAANLCRTYTGGGYRDWYLPSKDELNELYKQKFVVGGFLLNGVYWSSSEFSQYSAWDQYFGDGSQSTSYPKNAYRFSRAVRSF